MADFNLESHLKIHLTVFRYLGFWPNKSNTILYKCLTILVISFLGTISLSAIIKLFILLDDLEVFMRLCYMAVSVIIICVKSNYFIWYQNIIEDLVKGLQNNKPKFASKQNQLINNYLNKWNYFFIFMSIIVPINGNIFFALTPFFMDSNEKICP